MTSPTEVTKAVPSSVRSPIRESLAAGLWWGVIGGVLELSVRQIIWAVRPRVTVESIRTNAHHLWMVPASNVLLLGLAGLGLGLLSRVVPRLMRPITPLTLATLASLGAIRLVDQLHSFSGMVLALGIGAMAMRAVLAREDGYRRVIRVGLVPALALLAVWTAFQSGRVLLAEKRAIAALPPSAKDAPNVLLVVMDNVRADDLSLYGYARDTTPNLRRLAERGARFDLARSTASWTLPSHASMLTGRWPHELSVTVDTPLDDARPTLAEALSAKGYATAGFVANTYYCNAWYGLDRGFSRYEDFQANAEISLVETLRSCSLGRMFIDKFKLGTKEWPGEEKTRKTAERINRDFLGWMDKRGDRPFFAFLNYYDAHAPFRPPVGSPRRFGLSAKPEPERLAILHAYEKLARRRAGTPAGDPAAEAKIVAQAAELLRDSYDDCIASLDQQIGRLFADLERRGVLDNTLVILTADHGEEFNEKTMFGHGISVYRPEVHVPLIVMPPKGATTGGHIVRQPASLRDIAATVADFVDLGESSPFPGSTLARFWTEQNPRSGLVLSEVEHQTKFTPTPSIPASLGPISAIVEGRYVYILNAGGREEVYDMEGDPGEARNLAETAEMASLLPKFRATLEQAVQANSVELEPRLAREPGNTFRR